MADRPLRPATDRCLGRPLPHQLANPPHAPPKAPEGFGLSTVCGISFPFGKLSPTSGQVRTCYSPVRHCPPTEAGFSCDLHALGTPPTFILSQDQTLQNNQCRPLVVRRTGRPEAMIDFSYAVHGPATRSRERETPSESVGPVRDGDPLSLDSACCPDVNVRCAPHGWRKKSLTKPIRSVNQLVVGRPAPSSRLLFR